MELTLREVAALVGGEIHGNADHRIRGVCALGETGERTSDHLGFLMKQASPARALASRVSSILVAGLPPEPSGRNWVVVADPQLAFALVAQRFHPLPRANEMRVHPSAVVAGDAVLEAPVDIGPHAVIESRARIGAGTIVMAGSYVGARTVIGRDCILHARVVIYEECVLGDRVRLHSGAVIGADGFGNAKDGARYVRIPQIGNVILEDDVEVGACATIDRSTLGATRVRRGTKIDNLVMIGHNCEIGEDTAIAAQVGMAGSTKVGSRCMLAGQVGLAGHLEIGDDIVLGAKSGAMSDMKEPGFFAGQPAVPGREYMKMIAEWRRLGELRQRVNELEKRLASLTGDGKAR